jgi:dihydroorotate dehydrogenase electron transfer subunit
MRPTARRRTGLWGAPMREGMPEAVTITAVVSETPSVRTFSFDRTLTFGPGQFVMVWVPGVDEIPMALSARNAITVQKVGDATSALFRLDQGDRIGLRGPLGNGFSISGRTLAVAGGVGAAPLRSLAMTGQADTFLLGARTAGELVYSHELAGTTDLHIATDDGTAGHHGFVTDLFDGLELETYQHICVCGPEVMMRAVLAILDGEGCAEKGQFSLQRYMKCGVGLCGSCCIDPLGLRVCKDGPVFTGDLLLKSEFGSHARDASGRKIPI